MDNRPQQLIYMHKSTLNISENIDPNIVLNKTRIVKCIAKIKLVLDKNENQIPGFKKKYT